MLISVLELASVLLGLLAISCMGAWLVQAALAHIRSKHPGPPKVKCQYAGPELRRGAEMWNALGRFRREGPRA